MGLGGDFICTCVCCVGRYINDACDLYEEYPVVNTTFNTGFTTNAVYTNSLKRVTSRGKYGVPFVNVMATVDIPAGVEVFVSYGPEYWEKEFALK